MTDFQKQDIFGNKKSLLFQLFRLECRNNGKKYFEILHVQFYANYLRQYFFSVFKFGQLPKFLNKTIPISFSYIYWTKSLLFSNTYKGLFAVLRNIYIIQLLPFCEGNMTVCSLEAGNIARGRSPRVILPVEGEQIVNKGQQLFYYTDLFYYFFQSTEKLKLPRFICSHIYNRCFR